MKKIFKSIAAIIIMCMIFTNNVIKVNAADNANIIISLNKSQVSIGDNVTATITIQGNLYSYKINVVYDSTILEYKSYSGGVLANGSGGTIIVSGSSAGSFTLTFTAIANGSARIYTKGDENGTTDVNDINQNTMTVSHAGATVTVATASNNEDGNSTTEAGETTETTEDDGRSADCDLSNLQVSPGTLSPAFSAERTTYSLQVDEDVTSVVVSASAADSKATTSVSGANSIQKGKNTVRVTVTAENGAVKVYTINVQAGEDVGDPVATIDGTEYAFVMSEDGLEAPEGFTAGTTTYKDWDVLSFQSPNKKITVVCLKDEEGENHWFIMDAEKDVFTPYQEYSSQYNRYIIMDAPEGVTIPDGFTATKIKIGENEVTAYQSANIADADMYLVYAVNVEGEAGFYEFDAKEQAFLRYVPMTVTEEILVPATPTQATASNVPAPETPEKSPFSNPVVIGILAGLGLILVILIVILVIFAGRINKQNKDMLDAEDMIAQLANANKDVNPELLAKLGLDEATLTQNGRKDGAQPAETGKSENATADAVTTAVAAGQEMKDITKPDAESSEGETTILSTPGESTTNSVIPEDVNELMEEVNRDFAASMGGGEAYVEKSEKELAHEDYEKRSMEINNKIMTNYDSQMDSVFADGVQDNTKQQTPVDSAEQQDENK